MVLCKSKNGIKQCVSFLSMHTNVHKIASRQASAKFQIKAQSRRRCIGRIPYCPYDAELEPAAMADVDNGEVW